MDERPSQIWGIDSTADFALQDGQVPISAMIDHGSACCLGIHVARNGTWFEAPEPVRQPVPTHLGGFGEGITLGVRLRLEHGSRLMMDAFQSLIQFSGCIEHLCRLLMEQLLGVPHFHKLD